MKKLLALLLAMILCLGALVACDTPEESSSSSSEETSKVIRPSGDENIDFYYRLSKKTTDNFSKDIVEIADTYSEYASFASKHNLDREIPEEHFDNVYILLARVTYDSDLKPLGYYGLEEDNNGYWINFGLRDECHIESYNKTDGKVDHILTGTIPFSGASSSNDFTSATVYDIIVIFKSEISFEIDPSKPIDLYKMTYHFVG